MDGIIAECAKEAGFPPGAIRLWRFRGKVPYKHRDKIREAARQRPEPVEIPAEAFDAFGRVAAAA